MTSKQREIVELLAQGCAGREAAKELRMAERTVKAHLSRAYTIHQIKSGIKSVQLVLRVVKPEPKATGGRVYFGRQEAHCSDLLVLGLKNHEIAKRKCTTECVVKNCFRNLYNRTGCESRVMFAIWWMEHGDEAKKFSERVRHEKRRFAGGLADRLNCMRGSKNGNEIFTRNLVSGS